MRKILTLAMMSLIVSTVSCRWSSCETPIQVGIQRNQSDLYKIMALQSFSCRYGLPSKFTISCVSSNSGVCIQIFASERMIGRAVIENRYAGSGPEIRWLDCIKEANPIPQDVVPLALLWGYEKGVSYFECGFDVDVELSLKEDSVFVESHSEIVGQHYTVTILKGTDREIIVGFLGR